MKDIEAEAFQFIPPGLLGPNQTSECTYYAGFNVKNVIKTLKINKFMRITKCPIFLARLVHDRAWIKGHPAVNYKTTAKLQNSQILRKKL